MKEPKDFMTKKQQWISFAFGIVLLIIFAPSFLNFWKLQEQPIQIVMVIFMLSFIILGAFSGIIYKKHPKLWKLLTGETPDETGKNQSLKWKNFVLRQIKFRFIALIIIIIASFITLFIKLIYR